MSDMGVTLLSGSRETGLAVEPFTHDSVTLFAGEVVILEQRLGRPRGSETQARTRHFWTVLAATGSFVQALDTSRLDGRRMAKLLDTPEGRQTAFQLCSQDIAA